jgi:hypothetical protein
MLFSVPENKSRESIRWYPPLTLKHQFLILRNAHKTLLTSVKLLAVEWESTVIFKCTGRWSSASWQSFRILDTDVSNSISNFLKYNKETTITEHYTYTIHCARSAKHHSAPTYFTCQFILYVAVGHDTENNHSIQLVYQQGYVLDDQGPRIQFLAGGLGIFLFTTASRMALGPTQPPIQWVPGALSLGDKAAGAWSWTPPSSAKVKECVELYLHFPICLHAVVLSFKRKHKYNFTFTLPLPMTITNSLHKVHKLNSYRRDHVCGYGGWH